MPELPEVETVRSELVESVVGLIIFAVTINHPHLRLRYPIPYELETALPNTSFFKVTRRGKYLLLHTTNGTLLVHLGMSGKFLLLPSSAPKLKHEHLTIVFAKDLTLRFVDPRRFGAILWVAHSDNDANLLQHPALRNLGVEPLSNSFNARYLHNACQYHKSTIKQLLMNNNVVVGIGNIYACETLFLSGIKPSRRPFTLSLKECQNLVEVIKRTLRRAIKYGGTTIRDFVSTDGSTGNFAQQLQAYNRARQPCLKCGTPLKSLRLQQRSTVYCKKCQK